HYRFARVAKFVVGWSSHLYYWVYPGLMVGVFSALIQFIGSLFGVPFAGQAWFAYGVAIVMAIAVGSVAYRGIVGSTGTAIAINVIQIVSLIVLSILAIVYRLAHGGNSYDYSSPIDVVAVHNFANVVFQATIAILLLVGFESITSLGAETKDPKKNIPRGILLSLLIQGLIMYVFEYFAANFFMGNQYKTSSGTGLGAASTALAPIGDMAHIIGDWLGGWGFALTIIIGATVALAIIGTTLSCLNTGVRVTYAMGKDKEVPSFFGLMHGKFAVPHTGVLVLTGLSALVGVYCSFSAGVFTQVDTFTQVTYISNIGTLLLYGMTCAIVFVAFHKGVEGYSFLKHRIAPALGLVANLGLLVGVFYLAFAGGNVAPNHTETDALIAIVFVGVFIVAGIAILFANSAAQKRAIFHKEHPGFEA
ncbi:MAG TPA: APC family permease, partial [Ktedonobacterales bacterium]|nr:APC family permease [Ktedonobacterales bacterium]